MCLLIVYLIENRKQSLRKQKTTETMKTRMNQFAIAAITGLIILAGSVSAKGTGVTASSHETIIEKALEVESWMINEANWDFVSTHFGEENLQLESWMLDEKNWDKQEFGFAGIADENLLIESWVIDDEIWAVHKPLNFQNETERDIMIEPWMLNENVWN